MTAPTRASDPPLPPLPPPNPPPDPHPKPWPPLPRGDRSDVDGRTLATVLAVLAFCAIVLALCGNWS